MTRLVLFFALALSMGAVLPRSAAAETTLRFSLDWAIEGPAAPFFVALDQGFFKEEGLDVQIEPGNGSVEAVKRVGSGAYDMALGDINSLIRYVPADDEVRPTAIFMLYDKPPFAIIGRKSRGITDAKSLEGKTLGAPKNDGAFAQWPLFVKSAGIDASDIRIVNLSPAVREPMLAAGEVDAITGYTWSAAVNLRDKGVPASDIVVLRMDDYGLDLYGNAVMVDPKFAKENPEAVKGFIRALLRGLDAVIANPEASLKGIMERNPNAREPVELERLNAALEGSILTPEVRQAGIGAVDEERLARSIERIADTQKLKNAPTADEVFDAEFLPPEDKRRIN